MTNFDKFNLQRIIIIGLIVISSPANCLGYYSDAVGHWVLVFPISNYQLPITDLNE
jgi:hypothetical protein